MKSIRRRLLVIAALVLGGIAALVPRNTTERTWDQSTGQLRDTIVRRVPIDLGLDLRGGVHLALEIDTSKGPVGDCADAIRRAERVVRTRINEFGTLEPVIQVVGQCRLIVELPGMSDAGRARAVVQRTAFLEFRIADSRERFLHAIPAIDAAANQAGLSAVASTPEQRPSADPLQGLLTSGSADSVPAAGGHGLSALLQRGQIPGEFFVAQENVAAVERLLARPEVARHVPPGIDTRWGAHEIELGGETYRALYAVESRSIITGEALQRAMPGRDPVTNATEVRFELTREAGHRFADATGRNIGNHLAILLDGRVQGQPPVIRDRIGASGRIEMAGRTLEDASDLALVLRAGALPVPLQVVDQRAIGPTLGQDAIRDGVRASALAVLFVLVVMGVHYGLAGLLAVGGLFLYMLFALAGLGAFGFTLTLPGLAGFALSIGMAVDANVLVYERIREELAAGRTARSAVANGFDHAMSAIVDSNVTTALTAAIIYMAGTESVRGFAVTLLIGIAASMITAVFVTRTFFLLWLRRGPALSALRRRRVQLFAAAAYDFIRLRRWAYATSLAFIVPGLLWLGWQGLSYGIEFTGGTLVQVRAEQHVDAGMLRAALASGGVPGAEIQSFGSAGEYVVRARLGAPDAGAQSEATAAAVGRALDAGIGAGRHEIVRAEAVSPKVGAELQEKAILAVLFSFGTTLVYLAFRFEWRFGLAAVLATAHDIAATLALIRYMDMEVSLVVVAAVLTVLGYSLNDTIVIFDRIRENLRRSPGEPLAHIANRAINETLPRTLLTGGTTLATGLVLALFAGPVIRPFAIIMTFGIVVGTLSSIFVAAPLLLRIEKTWPRVAEPVRSRPASGGKLHHRPAGRP